ncbi:MAG TPA: cysteine--1-D-myo-inosityl 2-amino-2-deoxy-alpha-D-glucopyranoside ligase [Jiangellaceae bacterium]|nr:cysteine--1-D-myo-inosityl 2-amino-2-deoxy-alpha-D-glucopyranoside ligase [Jiangellaceae bacterium]
MQAWPGPHLVGLAGRGEPVHVHDTATGGLRLAAGGSSARMYVCGITPYDATHLGHAATYIAFDLLNRAWRDAGLAVRYVQNVTDIDDPLFERAAQLGEHWAALGQAQTELFREDMSWLRVLPPERFVGAVESIPLIIEVIDRLRTAGAAYEVDGDVYFAVAFDRHFGEISGFPRDTMLALFAERGGDPDRPGKKDPLDSLLWQRERPGEPAWESPYGRGRPGWHVECAAIALDHLGEFLDVQGGGTDLVFPHHDMSASVAHVATGHWPFARSYVHAGMIGLERRKMSKSEGNLVFVSRLRADGVDASAVRLALLSEHYRTDRDWSPTLLAAAEERLARWRRAVAAGSGSDARRLLHLVRTHLADDLDTPSALAAVDRWADGALADGGPDHTAPAAVRALADTLLGVAL